MTEEKTTRYWFAVVLAYTLIFLVWLAFALSLVALCWKVILWF